MPPIVNIAYVKAKMILLSCGMGWSRPRSFRYRYACVALVCVVLKRQVGLLQVTTEALVEWVQAEKLPPYLPFTDDNQEIIFNSGIKINVRTACEPPRLPGST